MGADRRRDRDRGRDKDDRGGRSGGGEIRPVEQHDHRLGDGRHSEAGGQSQERDDRRPVGEHLLHGVLVAAAVVGGQDREKGAGEQQRSL